MISERTNSTRMTARAVGALFISATVVSIAGLGIIAPILDAPDHLTKAAANDNLIQLGVFLTLINCAAVVAISALLYPVLRRVNEGLAIGYVGARIVECMVIVIGAISLLSLVTVAGDSTLAATQVQTAGALALAILDWTALLLLIPLAIGTLVLNYLLFRSNLIPRFISGWGVIGAISMLAGALAAIFGLDLSTPLAMPIALQEMVLAVWLIARGFNPSAAAALLRVGEAR
jgi:hypothetical protein